MSISQASPTPARWTGSCLCGQVRYEASSSGSHAVHCHCRMCQRATGAAFATWLCIPRDDLTLVAGHPRYRRSSSRCRRAFCPDCGTALFMDYDGDSEISVSLGSLDQPNAVQPSRSIWTSERLSWVRDLDRTLPQYPADPPD